MTNRYEVFADWLSAELEKREWNQSDLSRKSGVSTGLLSQILSGQRKAGAQTARAIAKGLQLPETEVMIQAGLIARPPEYNSLHDEIMSMVQALNDEDLEEVSAMLKVKLGRRRSSTGATSVSHDKQAIHTRKTAGRTS